MYLRHKLSLFLAGFIITLLVLSIGGFFIFDLIGKNIELMKSVSEEHELHVSLKTSIVEIIHIAKEWAFTGQHTYKKMYKPKRQAVLKAFGALDKHISDEEKFREIGIKFDNIDSLIKEILLQKNPLGNSRVLFNIRMLEDSEIKILSDIEELHYVSLEYLRMVSKRTDVIKKRTSSYLLALLLFSVAALIFIIIFIKKSIGTPMDDFIAATDRVSGGDLSYRVPRGGDNEFRLLSDRFNEMVDKVAASDTRLKDRLNETELLLDIAKIAGTSSDLTSAFNVIVQIITERTEKDGCAIYTIRADKKGFDRAAASRTHKENFSDFIPSDDIISKEAFTHLRPHFLNIDNLDSTESVKNLEGSVLSVPIIVDGRVFGILMNISISSTELVQDELNLFSLISHTIGTAIKNVELHSETKIQLKRLTALYELAKTVTSAINFDELFTKVTMEMTRLLNAKGCIIRILEQNRLPVKSSHGLSLKMEKDMDLRIGDGIAGWVAKNGKSLLVEDASNMPENMRVPVLDVKSVVCVPMKIADKIIGTIGLYDKKDTAGNIITFNFDDLSTAEGFASVTAVAIEKILAYERERSRERTTIEAKKRMEILFESVRGGIITIDKDWNILLANKYVENWTDKKVHEITGRNCMNVFHKADNPICPHCVAKATFETGEVNTITQSRGINYAELSSYPIKDESGTVVEAVVFIQDITDRVLYQEEILSLYKEVSQTKEYLESLIDNSADAIITTDLDGTVMSWNKGAEKIYGYTDHEAIGTFLPFLPEFLVETEKEYMEKLGEGETIKDIETVRVRKDGTMFEVSLTLSPIKDTSGEVIGISGISRDISDKKKVEKELIRRNQELSRLFFISSAMRSTLELEKLLRMVLTAVTMSDGLGFNRAILFMIDEEKNIVKGVMGVGPANSEEAWQIWDRLSIEQKTLPELLQEVEESPLKKDSFLDRLSVGMELSLDDDTALTRAVKEKKPFNIADVHKEPLSDAILIQQTGTQSYALIPMISRDRVLGVLWVDNYFNRKPITDEDIRFLSGFSDQVAAAVESARLFEQVKLTEAELENIFESISDMVYFNSKDYEIKSINKAVADKIGMPPEEIIGQKCYKIFHGMDHPWDKCPHHKTVNTKKSYVEELEDPHLGGTFLISSSPIFNPQDEFIGTVHVVRDISELKKLREKVATADRMSALGEVAAKVAHEIRNPLVSIGGFSRRLEKKLDGHLQDYASVITNEVTRLEGILKEILGYVREVRLTKETTTINSIIKEVVPLFRVGLREKSINLVQSLDKKVNKIEVDINKIKEGLINLVGNAIDAVSENGEIRIKTYDQDGYVITEISDTGHGVRRDDMPYLFDPFYTTKVTGTGLGLSITHRTIEQHNGKIEVATKEGEGTTFKIYLPTKEV